MKARVFSLFFAALLSATFVAAEEVTLTIRGTLSYVRSQVSSQFAVGDPFVATVVFDSAVAPFSTTSTQVVYAMTSMQMVVNGTGGDWTATSASGGNNSYDSFDLAAGSGGNDTMQYSSTALADTPDVGENFAQTFQLRFRGVDALSSFDLQTIIDLNDFTDDSGTYMDVYFNDSWTVMLQGTYDSITSSAGEVPVTPSTPPSTLSNMSVRTSLAAAQTLILGFVVEGGSKPLLLRAAGPALGAFNLTGMPDPALTIYQGDDEVAQNDDWSDELMATFTALGAFAFESGSQDAALIATATGSTTAHISGTEGGVVLVEAYDNDTDSSAKLVNLSARNRAGSGDDALIAGFAVEGTESVQLLIRAAGPALVDFGIGDAMADPKLEIYDADSELIDSNDNWSAELAATFTELGAFDFESGSADAAILVTLSGGSTYSAVVTGADGGTGQALVEVYLIEE